MPAVASSAPAVLIAHLANATTTLRVGSGGVMLPNHAPLVVAEEFGTLEALHPGRIDLGLGRAPGTDPVTVRALRRTPEMHADTFPDDVVELIRYLLPGDGPPSHPSANPGRGYLPEVWLLGSSLFSAQLAGLLGLPYSFAYHFAPQLLDAALDDLSIELPSFGAARRSESHGGRVRALRAELRPKPSGFQARPHSASCSCDRAAWARCPHLSRRRSTRSLRPRNRSSKRRCRHI